MEAGGLSASTIGRLKEAWSEEHARWSKRDLSAKRYIYFWVDRIHVQARLQDTVQCLLIIIGATPEGRSLSASPTACARVGNLGGNCSST
jgi:putative transposase